MHCIKCGSEESKVIDSRMVEEGNSIRRRRECLECKYRFTTYEKIEYTPIIVIKKNGERQQFNRQKIINGLIRACEKRPVSIENLEKLTDDIELEINNSMEKEIESEKIGEMVIKRLRKLDEIAYVRFASVYRQFKDINEFKSELNKLLDN
ncbi:transcriptional repressor NrdR [Clostridium sp. CAG:921]|nr:transcriptional repressor NrdR [Clostridium sp. CAG:921]